MGWATVCLSPLSILCLLLLTSDFRQLQRQGNDQGSGSGGCGGWYERRFGYQRSLISIDRFEINIGIRSGIALAIGLIYGSALGLHHSMDCIMDRRWSWIALCVCIGIGGIGYFDGLTPPVLGYTTIDRSNDIVFINTSLLSSLVLLMLFWSRPHIAQEGRVDRLTGEIGDPFDICFWS